jgi:hydrogenase nickel incorporation protein HypA/HybF
MHEFSLAEDLLNLAREEARKAGIDRLDKISVRIGSVSGVNIDSLEFAYGFLREQDEMTKNAELVVERVQGRGRCTQCGREVDIDRIFLFCPFCETPTVEIIEGREFLLVSLEGEENPDGAVEPAGRSEGKNG